GLEHQEQVEAQHTLRALDDDLVLQRPDPEGKLHLPEPVRAARDGAPVVVDEVAVAAALTEVGVDLLDGTQERLDDVEGVDAEIAERIPGRAVLRWQRAAC